MGVTAEYKVRFRAMPTGKLCGLPWSFAPRAHYAQDSRRWPHGVGEVVQGEFEPIALRLMPLRDTAGDPTEDFEPTI